MIPIFTEMRLCRSQLISADTLYIFEYVMIRLVPTPSVSALSKLVE